MTTYKLTIAYDGRPFKGWQRHPGQPTVQGALESAFTEVTGHSSPVEGSGRTDSGVHADAQVASVTLPDEIDIGDLSALNAELADGIEILSASPMDSGFHARKDSIGKTYRYQIWNAEECPEDRVGRVWHIQGALDVESMRAACAHFVGNIDFASFAKKPNFKQSTTRRNMQSVELQSELPSITITMRADSFLYKMVRNVVRSIVKVGEGRLQPEDIVGIIQACDRARAPGTAPASGLYLETVHF